MSAFVADQESSTLSREAVQSIFNDFDTDKSGSIDAEEFQACACALGHVLNDEDTASVVSKLDTDQNGTIDFEEFYAWISNDEDSGGERSSTAWEMAVLKAKLTAFYYQKKARNAADALACRLTGKTPAPGSTTVNIDLNCGNPPENGLGIEVSNCEGDGTNSLSAFLTLRDGATEEQVNDLIEIVKQGLGMFPLAQMIPMYQDLDVSAVEYRGGRALRFKLTFGLNLSEVVKMKTHVDVSEFGVGTFKVTLGTDVNSLLSGSSTLRQLFDFRYQLRSSMPNSVKDVIRNLGAPPPLRMFCALKKVDFQLVFDSFFGGMVDTSQEDPLKAQFIAAVLDTPMTGLPALLHSLVKAAVAKAGEAPPGALPPPVVAALDNFDALASLEGLGGVQVQMSSMGWDIALTGANVFQLIPNKEQLEAAADVDLEKIEECLPEEMKAIADARNAMR